MKRITLLLLAALLFASCGPNGRARKHQIKGEAQGTYYNIIYYDSRDLTPQIDSVLHLFDSTASLWVENSIIRRVNAGTDSIVSPVFADMLNKSLYINQYTNGAFNCQVGTLVNLYGFGFKHRQDVTQEQIDSILTQIRGNKLSCVLLDGDSLTGRYLLRNPNHVEIDFNAIAQGYTVDLMSQVFDRMGVQDYLIDVGGEVIGKGCKPHNENWAVGIEKPAENKYSDQEVEVAISLLNQSVVTSGNYRKYYEQDGVRYSHTIDPATGRPVSHSLLSVSVVSKESWYADAMATAFMVMGKDKALKFIEDHPDDPDIQAVYFIYDDHGTYKTYATPAFQKLIQ